MRTFTSQRVISKIERQVYTGDKSSYEDILALLNLARVDVLIVGGGGGSVGSYGAGGGAGEVKYLLNYGTPVGPCNIIVGLGGVGLGNVFTQGNNGQNSQFDSLIALGGGGAGGAFNQAGKNGGSGGGGGGVSSGSLGGLGLYGHNGGAGNGNDGGGGGGASADGQDAIGGVGGNGGNGILNSITGLPVVYGGGGGGVSNLSTGGIGGLGGGGNGGEYPALPDGGSGVDGLGGGAGGGRGSNVGNAGGGKGVVIVRYKTAEYSATGGTITTSGIYTIHKFTSNGVFNITALAKPIITTGYLRPMNEEQSAVNGVQFGLGFMLIVECDVDVQQGDRLEIEGVNYTVRGVVNHDRGNLTRYKRCAMTKPEKQ